MKSVDGETRIFDNGGIYEESEIDGTEKPSALIAVVLNG